MTRFLLVALLLASFVIGCTTSSRSVGTSGIPQTGTHYIYTPDNRLLQKSVWRHGKLVAAWEYTERGEDLSFDELVAAHRGERDWPSPRWVQRVINGTGRIFTFDEQGKVMGHEDYVHGELRGGAH